MMLFLLLMKMAKLKKCSMINIKKLRKVKAISSYELAKRIGKSAQYLHQIEKTNSVSLKRLSEICLALEYTHRETAQIILKELGLDVDLSCV